MAEAPGFGAMGGGRWNFGEIALLQRCGKSTSPGGGCRDGEMEERNW